MNAIRAIAYPLTSIRNSRQSRHPSERWDLHEERTAPAPERPQLSLG
jgi:hypothetical protein